MSTDGFNMAESIKQVTKHLDSVLTEGIINEEYLKRCTCREWIQYMTYLKSFIPEHMTAVKHVVVTMRYCPYCKTGLSK